ncbi:MAG: KGK domain-containing protein [Leptolyngbyaceae cyanobacterium bins.59]|nr:KGK domain-containing protein [Leptolyngbyaceae cyanobacterium bins.59]
MDNDAFLPKAATSKAAAHLPDLNPMDNHAFLPDFNDDDVISFFPKSPGVTQRAKHSKPEMLKMARFRTTIENIVQSQLESPINQCLQEKQIDTFAYNQVASGNTHQFISTQYWCRDGVDCEILKLGSADWQPGKIRIRVSVEFVPDEPELPADAETQEPLEQAASPLDEIRKLTIEPG